MLDHFPKINLHIHSTFSDGKNTIKQIIKKSLKLGLKYIAITDHFTDSWKAQVIPVLDSREKIQFYLDEIKKVSINNNLNSRDLRVFKGIEVDISSSERFIKDLISPCEYDIILFEYLESLKGIKFIIELLEYWREEVSDENNFPLLGLAHFDPSNFIHEGLELLISFLKEENIYFEFNSSYLDFYSRQNDVFYEKLKEYIILVAIGCDSHSITRLDDIEKPLELIRYYNLEDNYKMFLNLLERRR